MALLMLIVSSVILTICFGCYAVEGDTLKEAVLNIETEHGHIYDCVDMYKQPSLNHPALKDHKIQMSPNLPRLPFRKSHDKIIDKSIRLKKGCPTGTIPIPRLDSQKYQVRNSFDWDLGLEFAGLQTTAKKKFIGAGAVFTLYNPKVGPDQYSSAVISIESGDSTNLNQIQVGWTVDPALYGDTRTRLFTSWTADNYQKTGCFNTRCPGFISVNPNIPLDFVFPNVSVIHGKIFLMGLLVHKNIGGNWGLYTYPAINPIGYWPSSLFTSLAHSADVIKWGGQIFTPLTDDSSPQMGSGDFENGRYDKTSYMQNVVYSDDTSSICAPPDNTMIQIAESRCFFVGDASYKNEQWGYSFYFGGGGGKDHSSTCEY